jgi:hypothetical protein
VTDGAIPLLPDQRRGAPKTASAPFSEPDEIESGDGCHVTRSTPSRRGRERCELIVHQYTIEFDRAEILFQINDENVAD